MGEFKLVPMDDERDAPEFLDVFSICRFLGFIFNVPAGSTVKQAKDLVEKNQVDFLKELYLGLEQENQNTILENIQKVIGCDGPSAITIYQDLMNRKPQFMEQKDS
jgi:hypothetical protein